MTNKEYRQDPGISRSDLFEMRKSPLHFQYQMTHPKEDTPALLFGRALHKMILEPGDFESEFAVCPTVNRRTKAGQEQYAAFMAENEGKDIVSQDDYEVMCEMAEVINKHQLAKKLLTGEHEQSFFWTDPDTGEVKAMVSYPSYNNNRLANGIDSSYYASQSTKGSCIWWIIRQQTAVPEWISSDLSESMDMTSRLECTRRASLQIHFSVMDSSLWRRKRSHLMR